MDESDGTAMQVEENPLTAAPWTCSTCGQQNFAERTTCRGFFPGVCGEPKAIAPAQRAFLRARRSYAHQDSLPTIQENESETSTAIQVDEPPPRHRSRTSVTEDSL